MRKRLVRKAFDMIQDIAQNDNKEVGSSYNCIYLSVFHFIILMTHMWANLFIYF